MTEKDIYKQALNDILNSKSNDVSVLRKIALTAFTQPIKDIADAQAMNWMQFESQKYEWYLQVNDVHVACLSNEDMDGKKWVLMDYDSEWSPIFGHGTMPEFSSLGEGKKYCEMKFLLWLKEASLLLTPQPTVS